MTIVSPLLPVSMIINLNYTTCAQISKSLEHTAIVLWVYTDPVVHGTQQAT